MPGTRNDADALSIADGGGALTASLAVSKMSSRDDLLSRIVTNIIQLMSGTAVRIALGMTTLAIMARALGPALLGILVMVEAYGRLVDQFIQILLAVPALGVIGASLAHLKFNAIWLPAAFALFLVGMRRNAAARASDK